MRFKRIINMFEYGSVSVSGQRGRGKDMLMANVVMRRRKPYISNIDYGGKWIPYDYKAIDIGNIYSNFVSGDIRPYIYPYNDGTDIYLSDCGVYFPSQYCNELNKQYKSIPIFMALSRQLGQCNVHTNSQALARVWDKIREQQDRYILCVGMVYIKWLKLVIQKIRIYDNFTSAQEGRKKLRFPRIMFPKRETREHWKMKEEEYIAQHGEIKQAILIYRNKSNYDTRHFKGVLERGKDENKT